MTRLTFIILTLFLTAIAYTVFLSHQALRESRTGREQLKELALKLADESLRQSGEGPANPALTTLALGKINNMDKMPPAANPPLEGQAAAGLLQQARLLLRGSTPQAQVAGPAAAQALVYLAEAERLIRPISSAQNVVPRSAPAVRKSPGTYKVQRGETLWGISKKLYSTPWRWNDIWKINEAKLPIYRKLRAGTVLKLPT